MVLILIEIFKDMISYIDNLYLTEKTNKKLDKLKSDISSEKFLSLACIIVLSENEKDVFDIIPVNNLRFRSKHMGDLYVLGIAESRKAAMRLCSNMIDEYYQNNCNCCMRDYFKDKI